MFTRSLRLSVPAALAAALPAAAQSPFDVGRVFGVNGTTIASLDRDGTPAAFTLATPGFNGFEGLEFDAPRGRVVFIADINGNRSIGSVDDSLDPATSAVLRSGLGADATQVDVDPATGRIYWWEGGQIRSVGPLGGGVPVVEADSVPEPFALEADVQRGVYVGVTADNSQLFAGPLDPAIAPTTFDPLSTGAVVAILDVAIDPVSGDVVWVENAISTTSGLAASVIRSDSAFGDPTVLVGALSPSPGVLQQYTGVALVGDALAIAALPFGIAPGATELLIVDTTSGDIDTISASQLFSLDAEAIIDPIVTQPKSVLVDAGQTATLFVGSLDPAPSYQWFRDGSPLNDGPRISGTSTSVLAIIGTELTDTDIYTCRVIDSSGVEQISEPAIIAVRGDAPPPDCPADQNFNGVLDPGDFTAWIANYTAGCP
ncbi:MAG: immunoglobulin domain-containing protein [Phycisphaerales bacterium]